MFLFLQCIAHVDLLASFNKNIIKHSKQILHAFLFNIRNYSPEVINIQRREAELNIILPRVNNFDIKQKTEWNICFDNVTRQIREGKHLN